jgi:asparagine synthase (glutamine-hydrolysing)
MKNSGAGALDPLLPANPFRPRHFMVELRPPRRPDASGRRRSLLSLRGRWRPDEVHGVEVGRSSVTYLGCCLAGSRDVRRWSVRALERERLPDLMQLPGSYHVVVESPRLFAAFGDAVGLRRLFLAGHGDRWLVSDRADVVARRTGASLSDEWLALWLTSPPPRILPSASPWEGVVAVPPGSCVVWRAGQARPRVEAWWAPPAPERSRAEGAELLAAALTTAVSERLRRASAPSCDLSGGKDTTALACLADAILQPAGAPGVRLVAVTLGSVSPDNDDVAWAQEAVGHLPSADHVVAGTLPLPFDDVHVGFEGVDHPSLAAMHSARHRHLARCLRRAGRGGDHLAGHGGDQVVEAPAGYLCWLARRHPCRAFSRLRRHCARAGVPLWPALVTVFWPGDYRRWLARTAADVAVRRRRRPDGGDFGWGAGPRVPRWLTGRAVELVVAGWTRAARTEAPFGPDLVRQVTVARITAGSATARLHEQFMLGLGVRLHLPFLDRGVVEAALAVRPDERTNPGAFKPLLDAAVAGTVPDRLRARATKGHYSDDTAWGLHRNRGRILQLLDDARLVDRGLVDADAARDAVQRSRGRDERLASLTDMVSCERWLRWTGRDV